jgi:hypothetical protein
MDVDRVGLSFQGFRLGVTCGYALRVKTKVILRKPVSPNPELLIQYENAVKEVTKHTVLLEQAKLEYIRLRPLVVGDSDTQDYTADKALLRLDQHVLDLMRKYPFEP